MPAFGLEDRYLRSEGTVYLTGVQALVRLLFDRVRHDRAAGGDPAVFVSGYEGSPLAGYDLELGRRAKLLAAHNIVHKPGLNEELAATAVMGSQLAAGVGLRAHDGVLGVWYGKAPGLDRATDALRHAQMAGTDPRGGALALVGDDPNAKSSTIPCASELALADLAMPIFFPADTQDLLDFGAHAIELSRASGLWSAMKLVANVADAASTATVSPQWTPPVLAKDFAAYRHVPSGKLLGPNLAELERSLFTVRVPLALEYLRVSGVNRITATHPADRIGIITAGKSYLDVMQAFAALGLDEHALWTHGIRVLKLGVIHPVEPGIVREFATGLDEVVVVEEKRAFIESQVKEILYGSANAPRVSGKDLFTQLGELDPDKIARGLARRLGDIEPVAAWRQRRRRERISIPLLARTPYFCSGCPHNSSTKVPEGTLVGGGIGCHTMSLFMPQEQVGDVIGVTQMGGEGSQWIGMAPFVTADHLVQNIGDGTFTHSGSLGIRASVAAGTNITYKLLHNSAVAMTGGQDAVGALPLRRLTAMLLAEGVRKVIITSDQPKRLRRLPRGVELRHRDELLRSQEELAAIPGVTVLIHDQECAAEKRRKRNRGKQETPATKVVINERVCEGCGDCGRKSNCLSVHPVQTEFGRKTEIHQSSCNLDYSCLSGDCPSFLTVKPAGTKPRRALAPLGADAIDEPPFRVDPDDFTVRITGIGGTGVVTVAQILATAAVIAGREVRTLDQTGLAQKGGAVVSDVKVSATPIARAAKIADGECDLYLACDALVAADPTHLACADPGRTTAVVSTTEVPTGAMITDTSVSYPAAETVRSAIADAVSRTVSLDARGLAEQLFDGDQFANILQLGAAYQAGAIPLPAEVIEQAITVNGTAVEANLQAFRRGRQLVADPTALPAELADPTALHAELADPTALHAGLADPTALHAELARPTVQPEPLSPDAARVRALVAAPAGTELARLLDIRVPELIAYQNADYARSYAEFVEQVRVLEGGATTVTEAVARNLHKLMAYKDEYEVARLCLDEKVLADIRNRFGSETRVAYRLHPPVLRAFGMRRKISLGSWFRPGFRTLYAMRGVRGRWFDPFGHTEVRRVERALVEEYRSSILRAFAAAEPNPAVVAELAELPDAVRGYENIKLGNVNDYRARQAELLAALDTQALAAQH